MTMTTIAPAPVIKAVRVHADRERAFSIFTASMTRWWPKSHSTNASPIAEVVVEPRVGGRWYERGEDGSELQWGRVLEWEPPARLVLAWQLDSNWRFDPGFETEVEVRFTEDGPGMTRVELEHRKLDRFAETAERIRASLDGPDGWGGILQSFGTVVDAG